jgi:hypothetical protein
MGIKIQRDGDVFELCNLLDSGPSEWGNPSIQIRRSSSDHVRLRRVEAVLDLTSLVSSRASI